MTWHLKDYEPEKIAEELYRLLVGKRLPVPVGRQGG
jgi:hypothetical protein